MRIADAAAGTEVTLRGEIVPGPAQLTSPGGLECVYWARVGGEGRDGVRFWIADDSGRALIDPLEASIAARAEHRDRIIRLVDAELAEVEARIRAIKEKRKTTQGAAASELGAEHRRLKKLATLLCAVRARAKGNVHVGGTLEGQERYIAERSGQFAGEGSEVLRVADTPEITLREGDTIEVSGLVVVEAMPAELFSGGYRDMPTCAHLRPPAGGQLLIRGVGEAAPAPPPTLQPLAGADDRRPSRAGLLGWALFIGGLAWAVIELFGCAPAAGVG